MKIARSAKELGKLNSAWSPAELDADQEMITQEEKECFRKIGLKMDSSLVLGKQDLFLCGKCLLVLSLSMEVNNTCCL